MTHNFIVDVQRSCSIEISVVAARYPSVQALHCVYTQHLTVH